MTQEVLNDLLMAQDRLVGINEDARIGWRRPSGDVVEIPLNVRDLNHLIDIALNKLNEKQTLTQEEISAKVKEEGVSRHDFARLNEQFWTQLEVNREQSRVIGQLVTALSSIPRIVGVNHEHIQLDPDARIHPSDGGTSTQGTATRHEDDTARRS